MTRAARHPARRYGPTDAIACRLGAVAVMLGGGTVMGCTELPAPPRGAADGGSEPTGTGGSGGASMAPEDALPVCGPGVGSPCAAVTQLGTGWAHTCALLDDGTVRCWGANGAGQLGRGRVSGRETPGVGLTDEQGTLLVGLEHSCVLDDAGTLHCWGSNARGQLARDDLPFSATPVTVMADLASASLSRDGTCGLRRDGEVHCVGFLLDGQHHTEDFAPRYTTEPWVVDGLDDVTVREVVLGGAYACVWLMDDTIRCWGHGMWGQLGLGPSTRTALTPTELPQTYPSPVHRIIAKDEGICVLAGDPPHPYCWGAALPHAHTSSPSPIEVGFPSEQDRTVRGPASITQLGLGWRSMCALTEAGEVWCFGDKTFFQVPNHPTDSDYTESTEQALPDFDDAVQLSMRHTHACVLTDEGAVWCWGRNLDGQIGQPFLSPRERPTRVDFNGANR
ncbi:MAG: hypothetical protein AAGN82_14700 [Myxococcota bacterium]